MSHYSFENFKKFLESDPLIVCDTNVLLRPYRISAESMKQTLETFRSVKDSLWIPHQVQKEFQKHCEKERTSNFNKYRSINSSLKSILEKAKNSADGEFLKFSDLKYPRIEKLKEEMDNLIKNMQSVSEQYEKDIAEEVEKNREALKDDGIKALVDEVKAKGNVGNPFTMKEELDIFDEGEKRYKYKYPPGHEDSDKDKDDPTGRDKYGDLLIWKQVLKQAKDTNRDVVFVSRDVKEDWWKLDKDKKPVRPRQELFREFREETGRNLIVCTDTELFGHLAVLKEIDYRIANIEMMAPEICSELAITQDWQAILDDNGELTSYLIHSGELQDWMGDPLSDVEVLGIGGTPTLDVEYVEFYEKEASFHGVFHTDVEITAYTTSFSGHEYTYGDGICNINGSFSLKFTLNTDDAENPIYKFETVKFEVGGFEVEGFEVKSNHEEICIHCNRVALYYTKSGDAVCDGHKEKYDLCSNCGTLFGKGTLNGAFCENCEG